MTTLLLSRVARQKLKAQSSRGGSDATACLRLLKLNQPAAAASASAIRFSRWLSQQIVAVFFVFTLSHTQTHAHQQVHVQRGDSDVSSVCRSLACRRSQVVFARSLFCCFSCALALFVTCFFCLLYLFVCVCSLFTPKSAATMYVVCVCA